MPLYTWNGLLLRRKKYGDKLARSVACCCVEDYCRCAGLPETLCLTITTGGCAALNGITVTLTKTGSCDWEFSGPLACGDSWAFRWLCLDIGSGIVNGTLFVTPPACMGGATHNLALQSSSCFPLEQKFCYTQGPFGNACQCCATTMTPIEICFCVYDGGFTGGPGA